MIEERRGPCCGALLWRAGSQLPTYRVYVLDESDRIKHSSTYKRPLMRRLSNKPSNTVSYNADPSKCGAAK